MTIARSQLKIEKNQSATIETNEDFIEIDAIDAEISEIKSDAIVHYTSSNLNIKDDLDFNVPYSIGRTIKRTSGGKALNVLKNLSKNWKPIELGQIAVTESFGLNCKHIFHVAVKPAGQEDAAQKLYPEAMLLKAISAGIVRSIKTAESMKLESLAIPLFDRTSHHFPITLVAEIFCNTLDRVIENCQLNYLKHITIVTTQAQRALKIIKSYLTQRSFKYTDQVTDMEMAVLHEKALEAELPDLVMDLDLELDIDDSTSTNNDTKNDIDLKKDAFEKNDDLDFIDLEMMLEENNEHCAGDDLESDTHVILDVLDNDFDQDKNARTIIESKIKEAKVHQSIGMHFESMQIYKNILPLINPKDKKNRGKIQQRINLLKKEIVEREAAEPPDVSNITIRKTNLSCEEKITANLDGVSALQELGLHSEAVDECMKLFQTDCPKELIVKELTKSLVSMHSPIKAFEVFKDLIDRQQLDPKLSDKLKLLAGRKLSIISHLEVTAESENKNDNQYPEAKINSKDKFEKSPKNKVSEKKTKRVNLLPYRCARMKESHGKFYSAAASLGTSIVGALISAANTNKYSFKNKASAKTAKSNSKYYPEVTSELACEGVPDPEKEKLEAELSAAHREIINLKEQLRIVRDDLEKFDVLKGIPGAEYRSAPLPIAFAHNMVESEITPMIKMEKLRRALGIAMRYFASIVFADYHSLGCFSDEENKICREAFSKPVTDGTWFFASAKIVNIYKKQNQKPAFIREIPYLWIDGKNKKTKFYWLCNNLINLRNEIHSKVSIDDTTARDWLGRALPKWDAMLKEALPLCKYRLFYLEGIDDFGEDGEILYHLKWIMGEHLVPRSERVKWNKKLRKGKLYLWDCETTDSMDLTPFMAYEYNDITKTRETYCIEQIVEGRLTFATLRFPDITELPKHQQKIFTRENNKNISL
jgi:O-acetyl-ADP-ribose deacetylase (regulator of RNase III)